ncbi:nucleolar protein 14 [Myxozyma melibiosi]|uniref:Nucleolar protein 14 n=1 Tax=Myxozyma melibiosi TaxID=54550 RepID=A0ABR1F8S2_9ASCO
MAKSQLKQLKERLKTSGFTGQTNAKKQKRGRVPAASREDKDNLLASIRDEFNPFEVKTTKQKHGDILGRRVQGATGRPGLSKQIGEENRRRTLQKELERKNKAGAVVDRRFGEHDPNMTPEERMLERFTRERQSRSSRTSSLFNLEDDDGESEGLTHFGQSLSLDDEFTLGDSNGGLKRRPGDASDDDEPERKKSKNEVMKEVIAKSKMYKYERQKAKEEDLEQIEALDGEMDGLRSLLFSSSAATTQPSEPVPERDIEYDEAVRELGFDRRAQPSDRTKTEEELAEERVKQLKELEDQRLRRMRGENVDEDDEKPKQRAPDADADDLEDDFELDDAADFGFGKGLGDVDDEEEGFDVESGASDEGSDDDSKARTKKVSTSTNATPLSGRRGKPSVELSEEDLKSGLKFTYQCPSTYDELLEIFEDHGLDKQLTIIERIMTLYHPSLAAGNKEKLMKFGPLLIEHAVSIVDDSSDLSEDDYNKLVKKIYDLTQSYPEEMSEGFRTQLKVIRQRLQIAITKTEESDYPLPSDSMIFVLIGMIFSTSDYFHLIATPAMLLIGQHLSQFPISTLGDYASASLLARVSRKYLDLSKRVIPESINYLNLSIFSFITQTAAPQGFPLADNLTKLSVEGTSKGISLRNLKISDIMTDTPITKISTPAERQLALSILKADLDTLVEFASLWKGKDAYKELFTPSLELLDLLSSEIAASKKRSVALGAIRDKITETSTQLRRLIDLQTLNRKPLMLQQHKPIPIPTYAPKFEENYSVDKKSYDPNVQRQEISKLRAQVKKERKGALRELRKDNAFVSREKLAAKKKKDAEYHAMLARLERSVASEN